MKVNLSKINDKLAKYSKSNKFKNKVSTYVKENPSVLRGSNAVHTAEKFGKIMSDILKKIYYSDTDLQASMSGRKLVPDVSVTSKIEKYNGSPRIVVEINLNHSDFMSESLYPEKYPGKVSLIDIFNYGYKLNGESTRDYVYGYWDNGISSVPTRSLRLRNGKFFIQAAIEEFNALYSSKGAYACIARYAK